MCSVVQLEVDGVEPSESREGTRREAEEAVGELEAGVEEERGVEQKRGVKERVGDNVGDEWCWCVHRGGRCRQRSWWWKERLTGNPVVAEAITMMSLGAYVACRV